MSRGSEPSNPLTKKVVSGSGAPPRNEGRNAGRNTLSEEAVIGLLGFRFRLSDEKHSKDLSTCLEDAVCGISIKKRVKMHVSSA